MFLGQQIDTTGGLILSDSILTSEHIHNLFEDNSNYTIQQLQIILPFISPQWTRLFKQKYLKNIEINDLSKEVNEDNSFGNEFYQRLTENLNKPTVNFDIYMKLIPRDSSGTSKIKSERKFRVQFSIVLVAFDEPNLYILYGQQGEASLFGIRGFVTLVNGGFR
jgi:hypothetical protein